MKSATPLALLGLLVGGSNALAATPDIQLPSLVASQTPAVYSLPISVPTLVGGVVFEGEYLDLANPTGWASDLRMIVRDHEGSTVLDTGGFNNAVNAWDFQGSASNGSGLYSSAHTLANPILAQGDWSVEFQSDAPNGGVSDWSNANVALSVVPTPGSLVLLALGGVLAARRRGK